MDMENNAKKSNRGMVEYSDALEDPPIIVSSKVYSDSKVFDASPGVDNKTYMEENKEIENAEIKREGSPRCACGSGKNPDECCLKHLRVDKNPLGTIKEYERKEIEREIDEYDTPKSQKEYKETGASEESLIMIKKHGQDNMKKTFASAVRGSQLKNAVSGKIFRR